MGKNDELMKPQFLAEEVERHEAHKSILGTIGCTVKTWKAAPMLNRLARAGIGCCNGAANAAVILDVGYACREKAILNIEQTKENR